MIKYLNLILKNNLCFIVITILLVLLLISYLSNESKKTKKLNILHIGKTAGRAVKDSIKNEPNVKLARHQVYGIDLINTNSDIAAIIRDPKDRLVSAISWFRQGGEKGEMFKHPCHKYVNNKTIPQILSNHREFQTKCLFKNNAAFIPTTKYLNQIEDTVIPICFNRLQEDYDKKIKPYKVNNTELKVRNKSSRPKLSELSIEDHNALDNFINKVYQRDKEYYNKTCLQ